MIRSLILSYVACGMIFFWTLLLDLKVMALVFTGLLNKQVGGELGISEITVKAHRVQVMKKMKADSLPDLVKMSARLGLAAAPKG